MQSAWPRVMAPYDGWWLQHLRHSPKEGPDSENTLKLPDVPVVIWPQENLPSLI